MRCVISFRSGVTALPHIWRHMEEMAERGAVLAAGETNTTEDGRMVTALPAAGGDPKSTKG